MSADASCASGIAQSKASATKADFPNPPAVPLESSASIVAAMATARAGYMRAEAITSLSSPSSTDPETSASATASCDADLVYTISMAGQSGAGYLKPQLTILPVRGVEQSVATASASLGSATISADSSSVSGQEIRNETKIQFTFGEQLELHLHLAALSTTSFVPGVSEPSSQARADFTGVNVYLTDDIEAQDVTSQCAIIRQFA